MITQTPNTAAADAPPEVRATLAAAGLPVLDGEPIPLFNVEAVAAAVLDRAGRVVEASPVFIAMQAEGRIDDEVLAEAARKAGPAAVVVGLGGAGGSAIFAHAQAGHALGWRLPPQVRAAAERNPGHVVVLTSQSAGADGPLAEACRAYGFTGLQTRVALETIRTGGVRTAAEALELSYHTARTELFAAMQQAGASKVTALVSRLASLAFGVLPQDGDSGGMLCDLWSLSPRQAAIAGLVAEGLGRAGVAQALGVSEAVVKKELDRVYLILEVSSAAGLARRIVEANALRWLTRATGGDTGFLEAGGEPLQFVLRPDGTRIAVSDYGPASGRPVLVVHSSMTTRIVARSLLRALQAEGYRPISIDRPGFGLTDEIPGMRPGAHDPFAAAAYDTLYVLDHLKLRDVDLVTRGAAQFVLALGRLAPERLKRVVLTNPAPHTSAGDRNMGALGAIKEAFRRNPAMIRMAGIYFTRQSSFERLVEFMAASMRGSPPDEAACRDPEVVRDYFRATRMFPTGRLAGYVNEQTEFAQGSKPAPLPGTNEWRVIIAAHDVLHDPEYVMAYFRDVLPDAVFVAAPDAGRLLALSHPHYVVAALKD